MLICYKWQHVTAAEARSLIIGPPSTPMTMTTAPQSPECFCASRNGRPLIKLLTTCAMYVYVWCKRASIKFSLTRNSIV